MGEGESGVVRYGGQEGGEAMGETGREGYTAAVITAFKGLVVPGKIGKYNIKIGIFSNNFQHISNFSNLFIVSTWSGCCFILVVSK